MRFSKKLTRKNLLVFAKISFASEGTSLWHHGKNIGLPVPSCVSFEIRGLPSNELRLRTGCLSFRELQLRFGCSRVIAHWTEHSCRSCPVVCSQHAISQGCSVWLMHVHLVAKSAFIFSVLTPCRCFISMSRSITSLLFVIPPANQQQANLNQLYGMRPAEFLFFFFNVCN